MEVNKLKVAWEAGGAAAPAPGHPSSCSHLRALCHFQAQPRRSVCLEGESKCIWPQLCLPWWVAIRLDCVTLDWVTPSSSAQDRSVCPRAHAYPLLLL